MQKTFSIKLGDFLYQKCFWIYNIIYPIFKKFQDGDEINLLKKLINKGDIVFDIGSNIGFYSKILSEITGHTGKVYSFEPDKKNYQYFLKNIQGINNIIPNNKAISAKTEKLKIYTSKFLNVDHRTYPVDNFDKIIEIEAISVDDYINYNFTVDFIKMDIQGYEYSALQGMLSTITNNPGIKILTEFWPYGLNKAGVSVRNFIDLIESLGLNIFTIKGSEIIPFDKSLDYQNWKDIQYENLLLTKENRVSLNEKK